jgi:osmotically inducible protein OsmC
MALSAQLEQAGLKADRISTEATVSLEKVDGGFAITAVHLAMTAKIPNATEQQFENAANNAKAGCPVSKLFNTKITLDAKLEK